MRKLLIVLTLLAVLTTTAFAVYAVGDTPPDFTCDDTYGNSWNLHDQQGKVVMVNFGATW
ncbi:MAG: redoxin domain-containing protein [Candidatus Delongbacteria bacterium]|nr:redoxin domain-containing protein [Candidatus Delongbacteria bacterium]